MPVLRRSPRLALITGCPRSATTAVLEWLGTCPGVAVLDEPRILIATHAFLSQVDRFTSLDRRRRTLVRPLRSALEAGAPARRNTKLLVLKEPLEPIALPDGDYRAFLDHARELVPRLRILFLVRHPVTTIGSILKRKWGYTLTSRELRSYGLEEAIAIWRANAALGWSLRRDRRVLLIRFESIATKPELASRRVLRFLGLAAGPAFVPKAVRPHALTAAEQERILKETARERRWFGY